MKNETVHLGIDVSKKKLDMFDPVTNRIITLENAKSDFRKIHKLACKYNAIVCCEPTGGLELEMVLYLQERNIPVAYCDGYRVRHFALSLGQFAKNDPIDARMISRFADSTNPRILTLKDNSRLKLRNYLSLYRTFIDANVLMAQKASSTNDSEIQKMLTACAKQNRRRAEKILSMCMRLINEEESLKYLYNRFLEIDGVGNVTALTVIAELPEIGTLNDEKIAKLAGVAPLDNQSGETDKTKRIHGGRRDIREALYMAAVSAIKYNHVLSPYYYKAKERMPGPRASKWAIVPVMRKLIHLMNHLARNPEFELDKKPTIKVA